MTEKFVVNLGCKHGQDIHLLISSSIHQEERGWDKMGGSCGVES